MPTTTQAQLAKKLGLSRSTIAAALNPNSPIKLNEDTIQRVQAEAARLNYRPHHYAQIMRGGKSGLIGIFHFGGLSQVAAERAWHASRAVQEAGYKILSSDISWSPGGAKAGCEAMVDAKVEGVLVAGLNDPGSMAALEILQKTGLPLVTLSGNELKGAPHIRGDARDAIARMTRHLISLKRRRLLFLTYFSKDQKLGNYLWAGAERLKGFKAMVKSASGVLVDEFSGSSKGPLEGRIATSDSGAEIFDPFRASKQILARILREPNPPDAVLCGNDDWAIGALAACHHAGLHVPHDIAITGYDNIAMGAYLDVPLTTIAQPSKAMAEKAVELLLRKIQGKRVPAESLKFPCELIVRESCGARKSPNPTTL